MNISLNYLSESTHWVYIDRSCRVSKHSYLHAENNEKEHICNIASLALLQTLV